MGMAPARPVYKDGMLMTPDETFLVRVSARAERLGLNVEWHVSSDPILGKLNRELQIEDPSLPKALRVQTVSLSETETWDLAAYKAGLLDRGPADSHKPIWEVRYTQDEWSVNKPVQRVCVICAVSENPDSSGNFDPTAWHSSA